MNTYLCSFIMLAMLIVSLPTAAEEVPGTGFSLHLESAQIIGTGRSINIHRVPVVDMATDGITHYDVSVDFSLDESGNLIFDRISSFTESLPLNVENFIAGTYTGAKASYVLSGPTHVGDNRTAWTLTCTECRRPSSISWVTGNAVGNPDIGARPIAPDLPAGFSYGIVGIEETLNDDDFPAIYNTGALIGARQIGNALTVSLFDNGGTDVNFITASVTLILNLSDIPPSPFN